MYTILHPMSSKFEFKRSICFCDKRITKKFKCDWFQFYPLENYINNELKTTHFPFVLEYKISTYDIKKTSYESLLDDEDQVLEEDKEFFSKMNHEYDVMIYILRLLTILTNYHFFIYQSDTGWFINLDGKKNEDFFCVYGRKLYYDKNLKYFGFISNFSETSYEDIKLIKHSNYYQFPDIDNEENGELEMSQFSLHFFNKLESLSTLQKKYFDSAVVLINNGMKLRNEMKSLAFLAFISSIETMTALEAKINNEEIEFECNSCKSIKNSKYTCNSCGRPIWGISQQIKLYMEKFLSENEKLKTAINKLYNYRSKIAHSGSLLSGDIYFEWEDRKKREEHHEALTAAMQYSKMSLVNYVLMNQ